MTKAGFTLDLPIPPSVNNMFPGRAGRFKSKQYRAWILAAGWELKMQKVWPVSGAYALTLELPENMRGDVDNRLKGISDLLVSHRLTPDDSRAFSATAVRSPGILKDRCRVTVEARL